MGGRYAPVDIRLFLSDQSYVIDLTRRWHDYASSRVSAEMLGGTWTDPKGPVAFKPGDADRNVFGGRSAWDPGPSPTELCSQRRRNGGAVLEPPGTMTTWMTMTIAYRFSWESLPRALTLAIAWVAEVDVDEPAASIEAKFGDLPTANMVRITAPALVDRWLIGDEDALVAVSEALGCEDDPRDEPGQFARRLAESAEACESAAYWLFLRGLRPAGSVYDGLERPWRPAEPDVVDYSVTDLQEQLRALMGVDDEWIVVDGDDWTWWPTPTPIHIEVGPPRLVYGDVSYRVRARCPLVHNVRLPDPDRLARLSIVNERTTLFALVYNPEAQTVEASCAYTAHGGNESLVWIFSAALVLMASLSRSVDDIAAHFEGSPVRIPHPTSGLREDADELAYYVDSVVIPRGELPSPFTEDAASIDFESWPGCVYQASPDREGTAQAELAFYHDQSAFLSRDLGWPLGTSLVQIDGNAAHSELGSGMAAKLSTPDLEPLPPHFAVIAADLFNRFEANEDTGFTFFGAWWARRREEEDEEESRYDLIFSQFIPSSFRQEGLAQVTSWSLVEHNRWLVDWLDEFSKSVQTGD